MWKEERAMLILPRKKGTLLIENEVEITVLVVESDRGRLAIQALRSVTILRGELKVVVRKTADEDASQLELLGTLKE